MSPELTAVADPTLADAFSCVMRRRKSVRAFLRQPVPRPLLERVFSVAGHAPSNCNTQPWVVHVASGTALETLRSQIPGLMMRSMIMGRRIP